MLNQKAQQPINQTCKRNKVDKQCKYSKCTTKSVPKYCQKQDIFISADNVAEGYNIVKWYFTHCEVVLQYGCRLKCASTFQISAVVQCSVILKNPPQNP